MINNSWNITIDPKISNLLIDNGSKFREVCEINQYRTLESLQSYPGIVLKAILALFLLLYLYLIIANHFQDIEKKYRYQEMLIGVALMLSAIILYFVIIINYPHESIKFKLQLGLSIMIFGMVLSLAIQKYREHRHRKQPDGPDGPDNASASIRESDKPEEPPKEKSHE